MSERQSAEKDVCRDCGHLHTPEGCTGDPTPSDLWAGVSVVGCDCAFDSAEDALPACAEWEFCGLSCYVNGVRVCGCTDSECEIPMTRALLPGASPSGCVCPPGSPLHFDECPIPPATTPEETK